MPQDLIQHIQPPCSLWHITCHVEFAASAIEDVLAVQERGPQFFEWFHFDFRGRDAKVVLAADAMRES